MIHKNITVSGNVQGVFYRNAVEQAANQLGIKGFVQNLPNAKVYIEAEGSQIMIDNFIRACRRGSEQAKVEGLDIQPGDVKNYRDFEVKY